MPKIEEITEREWEITANLFPINPIKPKDVDGEFIGIADVIAGALHDYAAEIRAEHKAIEVELAERNPDCVQARHICEAHCATCLGPDCGYYISGHFIQTALRARYQELVDAAKKARRHMELGVLSSYGPGKICQDLADALATLEGKKDNLINNEKKPRFYLTTWENILEGKAKEKGRELSYAEMIEELNEQSKKMEEERRKAVENDPDNIPELDYNEEISNIKKRLDFIELYLNIKKG